MIADGAFEYGVLVLHVDKNKLEEDAHPVIQIVFCDLSLCFCVWEREKEERDSGSAT